MSSLRGVATSSNPISRGACVSWFRVRLRGSKRPDGWWWDPRRTTSGRGRVLPTGGVVAVGGGQVVFDLFLAIGFSGFHLSRAHGVKLPGGRSVFSACDAGATARTVLEQHRLVLHEDDSARSRAWRRNGDLAAHCLEEAMLCSCHRNLLRYEYVLLGPVAPGRAARPLAGSFAAPVRLPGGELADLLAALPGHPARRPVRPSTPSSRCSCRRPPAQSPAPPGRSPRPSSSGRPRRTR